jgi:hypothetical protein
MADKIIKSVFVAAFEYYLRKNYEEKPDGTYDKGSRWEPSDAEHASCCNSIRSPSRSWPNSLKNHCTTSVHIVTKYGVDKKEFNKYSKQYKELFTEHRKLCLNKFLQNCTEVFTEDDIIQAIVEAKL